MAYEIKRFPYSGTIDADGHILEPPDLWESYLEAKYRPRALGLPSISRYSKPAASSLMRSARGLYFASR
jgi:hypothetical protein